MKKVIIITCFCLIFCRGLYGAENKVLINEEKKLSEGKKIFEESKLLAEDIKQLKAKNKNLEKELDAQKNISSQLEEKARQFYIKAKSRDDKNQEMDNLKLLLDELIKERGYFKNKNEQLSLDIAELKNTLKKEKAELYEELGAAYAYAKLYDKAIEAYEKSLTFNRRNAEVYYYLGLLYKHSNNNDKKAINNLNRYLDYKPQAKNRDEVKYLIEMLKDEF